MKKDSMHMNKLMELMVLSSILDPKGSGMYGGPMRPSGELVGAGEREPKKHFPSVCCPKCSGKLKKVSRSPRKYNCKCGFIHTGKLSNIK